MPTTEFSPFEAIVGGAIIAASWLLYFLATGGGGGASCMIRSMVSCSDRLKWHFCFLLGLAVGGYFMGILHPISHDIVIPAPLPLVFAGGALIGYGANVMGGCTSGHGIIGNGRLNPRSLAATMTFLGTGIVTAVIYWSVLGGLQ